MRSGSHAATITNRVTRMAGLGVCMKANARTEWCAERVHSSAVLGDPLVRLPCRDHFHKVSTAVKLESESSHPHVAVLLEWLPLAGPTSGLVHPPISWRRTFAVSGRGERMRARGPLDCGGYTTRCATVCASQCPNRLW